MKSTIIKGNIVLIVLCTALFLSCEKKVEKPVITEFIAEPATAVVNQEVYFTVEHTGDYAVIWTGDLKSNYDAYLEQIANPPSDVERNVVSSHDKGAIMTSTTYMKRYLTAGVYTVVVIVSNVGDMGETIEQAMETLEITITE